LEKGVARRRIFSGRGDRGCINSPEDRQGKKKGGGKKAIPRPKNQQPSGSSIKVEGPVVSTDGWGEET